MKKVWIGCCALVFFCGSVTAENAQWVEWIGDVEVSYGQNDNLNLSAFANDEEDDSFFRVAAVLGRYYQFNGNTRMHISAGIASERFNKFGSLDNLTTSLNLGVRHKFGLGFSVPYVQFNISYRDRDVDTNVRDSDVLDVSLEVGKHLTDRFSLAGNVAIGSVDGNSGPTIVPGVSSEPFDEDFWTVSLIADYVISQDWLVSAGYTRRDGDFHSSCTPDNVAIVLTTESVAAITLDPAFNGCVYQLDGTANIFSATLSYAVSGHSGLNLGVQVYEGDADVLDYSGTSFQLSYNYRY
jgi:hypothetical protein